MQTNFKHFFAFFAFFIKHKKYLELFSTTSIIYSAIVLVLFVALLLFPAEHIFLEMRIVLACLLLASHIAMLLRIINEQFAQPLLNKLRYYRFSRSDLYCLGLLQVSACNALIAAIIMVLFYPFAALFVVLAIALAVFLVLEVMAVAIVCYISSEGRQQTFFAHSSVNAQSNHQIKTCADGQKRFWFKGNACRATLFRDIKLLRKSALFFELPLCLILSFGALIIGVVLPAAFVVMSYVSYLIILFQILYSCFEAEFSPEARHYVLLYRISSAQICRSKILPLLYCSSIILTAHSIFIILLADNAMQTLALDVACLGLALLVLYCSSWLFQLILKHQQRLYPLAELLLFIVSALIPIALCLGLVCRAKTRSDERRLDASDRIFK